MILGYSSRKRKSFQGEAGGGRREKDDEVRRVYTRGWGSGVKEKDIRVRKNESIRADAEGPSTADKRDS